MLGATGASAFAGIGAGTDEAQGLSLSGVDFALALVSDKDNTQRRWTALQASVAAVRVDPQVLDYAVRIARATRTWPGLAIGAGPRASIALVRCGRARALLRGGDFVLPDDIKGCALAVLRHRVRLSPELDIEGLSVDQVLQQLLDQVPAPRL